MTFLYYTLFTLLLTVAALLILLILIQKGRGGGLSGAFGGGGGSQAFGAKTGDVLTWATSIVFGVFIVLAVALDLVVGSQYKTLPSGSTTPILPTAPVVVNNPATPTNAPAGQSVNENVKTLSAQAQAATTQAAVTAPGLVAPSIGQAIGNATTQAAGTVKAATQPVDKLLGK